jgi:hypothetical protein
MILLGITLLITCERLRVSTYEVAKRCVNAAACSATRRVRRRLRLFGQGFASDGGVERAAGQANGDFVADSDLRG